MQAAAGYGQPIMQAAAGVGEYFANPGVAGIGEYELAGYGQSDGVLDEGIPPNIDAAEYAISRVEAMSGGCSDGVNTWIPETAAVAIDDGSDGCRTGILDGRGGVFD